MEFRFLSSFVKADEIGNCSFPNNKILYITSIYFPQAVLYRKFNQQDT